MDSLDHVGVMDDRRDYRDDLLHVAASLLAASITCGDGAGDREVEWSVKMAGKLIREVDRFVLRPAAGCEQRHVHETGEGS